MEVNEFIGYIVPPANIVSRADFAISAIYVDYIQNIFIDASPKPEFAYSFLFYLSLSFLY
jgi:hypothetical protein